MKKQMPFNEADLYRMDRLFEAGYGWQKYSESVRRQGWISLAQREKLSEMLIRLRGLQCDAQRRKNKTGGLYEPDISDQEAMASGDYF